MIALHQIGRQELVPALATALVPPAVAVEILPTVPRRHWLAVRPLHRPIGPLITAARLDPGESEVIALAIEIKATLLVIDDRRGRRLAATNGLSVTGTGGLLLIAMRAGLLAALRPEIDDLLRVGLYLAPDVIERALIAAGERP